jgi:hypothetical protein
MGYCFAGTFICAYSFLTSLRRQGSIVDEIPGCPPARACFFERIGSAMLLLQPPAYRQAGFLRDWSCFICWIGFADLRFASVPAFAGMLIKGNSSKKRCRVTEKVSEFQSYNTETLKHCNIETLNFFTSTTDLSITMWM